MLQCVAVCCSVWQCVALRFCEDLEEILWRRFCRALLTEYGALLMKYRAVLMW